jgi:hypothetical protein
MRRVEKSRGDEESPRLKIGRHDKLHAEIPVLSFRKSSHLLPQIKFPAASSCTLPCFVLYASLLGPSLLTRIIAKSSGTIQKFRSHRTFTSPRRLSLDISHRLAPHLEENHLRQIIHYCNLSPYIHAEMQHSSSSLLCHAISISTPLIQYMLSLPNIPFIHTFLLRI